MKNSQSPTARSWRTHHTLVALLLPQFASAALPLVDFSSMGLVGLAGDFAGLGFFDNSSSVSFDPSTSSLLSRSPDGSLSTLGSTNTGGKVLAGCEMGDTFYFGGSFSSIGNVSATNVASFTSSSSSFSSLSENAPNGQVNAMFCDSQNKLVWVAGKFSSPGESVAVWNEGASSWTAAPFGGLAGALSEVQSITTNSSAESLFFAGSFITTFQSGNSTIVNSTNNPNVPFSAGATPFSSSLVPIPLQGDLINAAPASSNSQFSNINNVLCPSGPDGPGDTWLAADGFQAVINVRGSTQLSASGIRLGNTFQSGRGTTGFSVTSIPDNAVQTLRFVDPTTGETQTCSNLCPLLTDSSIPYQDFLFLSPQSITGFQLTLSQWIGAGPGLHILQLLSSGAFVSAVPSQNNASCFAPNPSNITLVGNWTEHEVTTNIAGTVQDVLTSSVDVGTSSSSAPSITWMPYVSASGVYNVSMLIPGCTQFQDCALRTSVQVSTFPGGGLAPAVFTISQQNTEDVNTIIYSGPVFPSSPDFVATVTMTLADQPAGTGQGGKYELIADRIELLLLSVGNNSASGNGSGVVVSSNSTQNGFGFFEWPLNDQANFNATSLIPQSAETGLDSVALQLFSSLNAGAGTQAVINSVAHHSSGTIFLGGNFTIGDGLNIVQYKNGNLSSLSSAGLNGPVATLTLEGNTLYVGGAFTDTVSSSTSGVQGVASYDVSSGQWSALDGGVDGEVTDLSFTNGQLSVVGSFTGLPSVPDISASGFAVWDAQNGTWVNSGGFVIGDLTFIGNGTTSTSSQGQSQIIAGNIQTSLQFGSTGFVMLQNGESNSDGLPNVTPLGVQLQPLNLTSSASSTKRRSKARRSAWLPDIISSRLFARQSSTDPTPLPQSPSAPAPAVLAGAFWTNSSNSDSVVILGGNFSISSGSSSTPSQGVALYDSSSTAITGLNGNPISGTVQTLLVVSNTLYIGGEFTVSNSNVEGFAIYDLDAQQLDMSGLEALQASSGSSVVVRSLTTSASQQSAVFVAGTFSGAASVPCTGLCRLDTSNNQWSQLGSGINGEVASVAYAGDNQNVLVASGSIVLSDNTPANVAMFFFDNSSWVAVGDNSDIPGPVTAVTTDNGNSSSIFAAGRSSDGSSSFLSFWNGASWTLLNSEFDAATNVTQVLVVPLQDTHSANSIIEQDRMLLVSGSLVSSSFGNASSVLFDGQSFIPYISSASASGQPGAVYSLFSSISNFSFSAQHFLATGIVILISIAISAGVIFFLVLLGILWTLFARRDHKVDPVEYDDDNSSQHRPSSLLEHINAATRTTILGTGVTSPWENQREKEEDMVAASTTHGHDPYAPTNEDYIRAETPSDAVAGFGAGFEEQSRPAHARYSFDGTGDGELPLRAGSELEVLDDRDHAWWYARDVNTGKEGVVPAAYLY